MQRNELLKLEDYKVPHYLIDHTKLCFKLDEENTGIESNLTVRKNPESKQIENDLILNGENITLDAISLDGKPLDERQYKITESTLTINDVPNAFKLKIKTHCNPKANTTQAGLYVTKGQLCTFCEPEGFRKITYFLDRPDVQSTYETKIIANRKRYPILMSNGTLVAKGKLKNGKHWVTWRDPIKKPSYLFAVVAGQFDCLENTYTTQSRRDIKLKIYVDKGKGKQCTFAMEHLKKAMRWDEENYGRECELDEYKLIGVNDFEPAADENVGMNIFRQKYLAMSPETTPASTLKWGGKTIAHEYFHHWSGNRVTVRDWFQISLKEGLTRFRDQSYSEELNSKALERIKQAKYLREQLFSFDAYPIQPQSYQSYKAFQKHATTAIYDKGAEIYRMLQTVLGKRLFRECLESYFDRNRGKAAAFEDFFTIFSQVAQQDLSQYLLWIRQAGTPTLTVTDEYNAEDKTYTLKLAQTFSNYSDNKPVPIPVKIGLLDENGQALPLGYEEKEPVMEKILLLKDAAAEFTFTNIQTKPIPSLLRDFSAPVKLNYAYTDKALHTLMKYDNNSFCRWDAGKKYIGEVLRDLIKDHHEKKPLSLPKGFISTCRYILNDKLEDPGIIADLFEFPEEITLARELDGEIDVNAIRYAREFMQNELAKQLKSTFMRVYNRCLAEEDSNPGLKDLKNVALVYVSKLKDPKFEKIVYENFNDSLSINLSDSLTALQILVNEDCETAREALEAFYQKWRHDPEVLEEWIRVQAMSSSPNAANNLEKILEHKGLDLNQPDHASTLKTYFMINFSRCYSVEGIAFLERLILKLDSINSKSASDIIKTLNSWKSNLDEERQNLIDELFSHIIKHGLSNHLKIAVYKALDIKPSIDCSNKTNRQIHHLLSKQGIFATNSNLQEESSKQSCQLDNDKYKKYAENLLLKSMTK